MTLPSASRPKDTQRIKALKSLFGDADEHSLCESEVKKGQGKGTAYKVKPKTSKTDILTVTFYKTDSVLLQGPKRQVDEFESDLI